MMPPRDYAAEADAAFLEIAERAGIVILTCTCACGCTDTFPDTATNRAHPLVCSACVFSHDGSHVGEKGNRR